MMMEHCGHQLGRFLGVSCRHHVLANQIRHRAQVAAARRPFGPQSFQVQFPSTASSHQPVSLEPQPTPPSTQDRLPCLAHQPTNHQPPNSESGTCHDLPFQTTLLTPSLRPRYHRLLDAAPRLSSTPREQSLQRTLAAHCRDETNTGTGRRDPQVQIRSIAERRSEGPPLLHRATLTTGPNADTESAPSPL